MGPQVFRCVRLLLLTRHHTNGTRLSINQHMQLCPCMYAMLSSHVLPISRPAIGVLHASLVYLTNQEIAQKRQTMQPVNTVKSSRTHLPVTIFFDNPSNPSTLNDLPAHQLQFSTLGCATTLEHPPPFSALIMLSYIRHAISR